MKKPQLYIKNEKGRYVPYVEPVADDSNVLYKRIGKKYIPHSMTIPLDVLNEGVWVVTKHTHGIAHATADYLRELFRCERVSDLKEVSVAELGSMDKLAEYLCEHYHEIRKSSTYEVCCQIVGILFQYRKENGADTFTEDEIFEAFKQSFSNRLQLFGKFMRNLRKAKDK